MENFTATHLMETDGQRSPVSFLKFIAPIKGAIIYFFNLIIYLCVRERKSQSCKDFLIPMLEHKSLELTNQNRKTSKTTFRNILYHCIVTSGDTFPDNVP